MPKGMIQTGFFAGLSTLAIVTSMDMTNGGLYASLMQQYGTKEEAGAFVLTSIESGPLVTMMILGSTGAAYFEPHLLWVLFFRLLSALFLATWIRNSAISLRRLLPS